MGNSSLFCYLTGPIVIVATAHPDLYAIGFQSLHGLAGIGLQRLACLVGDGQGTSLVNDHRINLVNLFEGSGVFDENVFLCSLADADHQGGRRGESHGTRTSDYQHGNSREDGLGQNVPTSDEEPKAEGEQTDDNDCRHEDQGYLIHDTLNGGFRTLGLLYHFNNMGEHRLLSYLLGSETESALLDDGASQNLVSCFLFNGNRFARNHTLINISRSFAHNSSIDRDALARTYLDGVAWLEHSDGSFGDGAIIHKVGSLWL